MILDLDNESTLFDDIENLGRAKIRLEEAIASKQDDNYIVNAENAIKEALTLISSSNLNGFEDDSLKLFGLVLDAFMELYLDDDFTLSRAMCFNMLGYANMLSNVIYMMDKTPEFYIEQTECVYKRLVLTTARAKLETIMKAGENYSKDVPLYCNWAGCIFMVASAGFLIEDIVKNLDYVEELMMQYEFVWSNGITDVFNTCSFRQSKNEFRIKKWICDSLQKKFISVKKKKQAKSKRIAIYTDNWFDGHSTKRTILKYFDGFNEEFDFVLLYSERFAYALKHNMADTKFFKESYQMKLFGVFDPFEISLLGPLNCDFDLLIFPDASFDIHSLMLANMDIGDVKMSMTGYPTSVYGSKIDYFISGQDVETEESQKYYTEKLVLLPGTGAIHTRPNGSIQSIVKPDDHILVSGSWISTKTHYDTVAAMSEVFKHVKNNVKFRIFPGVGWAGVSKSIYPYINEFRKSFEDVDLEIIESASQERYIQSLGETHCGIDSFPWGGSNVVSDYIHMEVPVIVWQGDKWFNRIGPAMLRNLGFEELIAYNKTDYIDKCIKLIDDDNYREDVTERLRIANRELADDIIFNHNEGTIAFKNLIRDCLNR